MPKIIRVRDVVRDQVYDCAPEQAVMRGPYELFRPNGPVMLRDDGLVEWQDGREQHNARVASAMLGDTHPGERVLMRISPHLSEEWWLCEIVAIDGLAGN